MSLDAEMALLGAVLSGYEGGPTSLGVRGDDFYQPHHEWIWNACLDVERSGRRVDALLAREALGEQQYKLPNGPLYLAELMPYCPLPGNAASYAAVVKQQANRRRLRDLGARLSQLADTDDPAEMLNDAKRWLDDATETDTTGFVPTSDAVAQVVDVAQHGGARGIPTPWPDVDRLIKGYFPGRLYVVGARPGVGKSLWASNSAIHTAKSGLPVAVMSLEMPQLEWLQRCAAAEAKIDIGKLEGMAKDDPDWERLDATIPVLGRLPMDIYDEPIQTMAQIRSNARATLRRHGSLGMVIVDYLQLVAASDKRAPRHEQVADISRSSKLLAREFACPVITLAQVNRGATARKDGRPALSDLRESGAIEADADSVILLHTSEDEPHIVEAAIAKGRSTAKGTVNLMMQGHYSRLVERWSPSKALGAA